MNLVKSIEQYNDKNTFFCEPIKNNIMSDGNFIRILYSTQYFMLNGIYLLVNLNEITCEKFYSKYKCNFNISDHKDIIDKLKQIEEQLLKKYNTNKIASYKIYEQLKSGYIKIFTDVGNRSQCSFILKISGIWETQYNYGLTYKFLKVT
jgi:Zn-dependent M16 (insulinase) family peptidase